MRFRFLFIWMILVLFSFVSFNFQIVASESTNNTISLVSNDVCIGCNELHELAGNNCNFTMNNTISDEKRYYEFSSVNLTFWEYRQRLLAMLNEDLHLSSYLIVADTNITNTTVIENTTVTIAENITISDGGVLIIKNSTVLFKSDGGIVYVKVLSGGNLTIIDSVLKPNDIFNYYCIIAEKGSYIKISSSKIVAAGGGLFVSNPSLSIFTENVTIENSLFDGSAGVFIRNAANIRLINNTFLLSAFYHLKIVNSSNIEIIDSKIQCRYQSGGVIITVCVPGIILEKVTSVFISNVGLSYCSTGIQILNSSDTQINTAFVLHLSDSAFLIKNSHNVSIIESTIENNKFGIKIFNSSMITVANTCLTNDGIWFYECSKDQIKSMNLSNVTVNGKEITIVCEESGIQLNGNYGQVFILFSNNIRISGLVNGIEVYHSSNITITKANIEKNDFGLLIQNGSNIDIEKTNISYACYALYAETVHLIVLFNTTLNCSKGIYLSFAQNITVDHVKMMRGKITAKYTTNLSIENSTFSGLISVSHSSNICIANSSFKGISLSSVDTFYILNNDITISDKTSEAIYINSCHDGEISNNIILEYYVGIKIELSARITVRECDIQKCTSGIVLTDSSDLVISNNLVKDNNEGVYMTGVSEISFTYNSLINDLIKIFDSNISSINVTGTTVNEKPVEIIGRKSMITLQNAEYGELLIIECNNISVKNISAGGIFICDSINISISYAFVTQCDFGIYVHSSNHVYMSFVHVEKAYNYGIFIYKSSFIEISNSTIVYNKGNGIEVTSGFAECKHIRVFFSNIFSNTRYGIFSYDVYVDANYNYWGSPRGPVRTLFPDAIDPEEVFSTLSSINTTIYLETLAYTYDAVPPEITFIDWSPKSPLENESVNVTVTVEEDIKIVSAYLYYSLDKLNWVRIIMNGTENTFNATISGQKRGSTVFFYVEILDWYGNKATSKIYNYTVINDTEAPIIAEIKISPKQPYENQSIKVQAKITDNIAVSRVYLYYKVNESDWNKIEMQKINDEYAATIPGQRRGAVIQLYIEAIDLYGNRSSSDIKTITVFNDTQPPVIKSFTVPENPPENQDIEVIVEVYDNVGVAHVYLYFKIGESDWTKIEMIKLGNMYKAKIPGQPAGTVIYLYVEAIDTYGNTAKTDIKEIRVVGPSPPSYLIPILIAIIIVIAIIVILKKKPIK